MFQRTPFSRVIDEFTARLASHGLENHWFGLQGPPQFWLGDYQVCLSPGKGSVDEGTMLGTGVDGTLIRRPVVCNLLSRSYEDEGERATVALHEHLAREEQLIACMHLYMPTGVNTVVVEPFKLSSTSEPQQKQGIITSVLVFDALYPALLELPNVVSYDGVFMLDSLTPMLWGRPEDGFVRHKN